MLIHYLTNRLEAEASEPDYETQGKWTKDCLSEGLHAENKPTRGLLVEIPEDAANRINQLACDHRVSRAMGSQPNRQNKKVINGQLSLFKGEVDQVLGKTLSGSHSRPVTPHSKARVDRIWNIISEINRLRSLARDIPVVDLNQMNIKVEDAKSRTFGVSYFVPDPH